MRALDEEVVIQSDLHLPLDLSGLRDLRDLDLDHDLDHDLGLRDLRDFHDLVWRGQGQRAQRRAQVLGAAL